MKKVFIDTSAWISLVAAKDPYHKAVAGEWRQLLAGGAPLLTSNDVISETITHLRYHAGHGVAVSFWQTIGEAARENRLAVKWVDEALFNQAWKIFSDYADQDFSMADCTSFALCQRERITRALTLDRHFQTVGLEVIPNTI